MTPPIVFIHGTNAGSWTMANFSQYFEQRGFCCHNPTYRYHDQPPTEEILAQLSKISIADYVEDIADVVKGLDTKPILIGHSLGGVIAQKVASLGLARAIILLNGSVKWGILPTTDPERELGKRLMAAGEFWENTLLPDFETMQKFGLNKLEPTEQQRVFERLIPESGRVIFLDI